MSIDRAVLDRLGIEVQNHTGWQLQGPDGHTHRLDDFTVGGRARRAPRRVRHVGVVAVAVVGPRLAVALIAVLTGRSRRDGDPRALADQPDPRARTRTSELAHEAAVRMWDALWS